VETTTITDVHPSPKKWRAEEIKIGTGSEVRTRRRKGLYDYSTRQDFTSKVTQRIFGHKSQIRMMTL